MASRFGNSTSKVVAACKAHVCSRKSVFGSARVLFSCNPPIVAATTIRTFCDLCHTSTLSDQTCIYVFVWLTKIVKTRVQASSSHCFTFHARKCEEKFIKCTHKKTKRLDKSKEALTGTTSDSQCHVVRISLPSPDSPDTHYRDLKIISKCTNCAKQPPLSLCARATRCLLDLEAIPCDRPQRAEERPIKNDSSAFVTCRVTHSVNR